MARRRIDSFYIDFEKLDQLIDKKREETKEETAFSDAAISKAAKYDRRWLFSVRRSETHRVDLAAAQEIAAHLGCCIQDFKAEPEREDNPFFNPVRFDSDAQMKELRSNYKEVLIELLYFLKDNPAGADYLRLSAMPRARIQCRIGDVNDEWLKMLYVSAYARTVAKKLEGTCSQKDFFDRYYLKLSEVSEETKKQKTQERISREIIAEIITKKFAEKVDEILNREEFKRWVADECAEFLYRFITLRANDPTLDLQVGLYRNGELY